MTSAGRPLVFAHRGASAHLPEHTLDAYQLAIAQGADGLECDVRLTRDGHLVCIHDSTLNRTSNGRGRVSTTTLPELEMLDFGSWWGVNRSGVLTLAALLEMALDAGRPLRLLIETKHPSRYGALVEQRLVETLDKYGLLDPGAVSTVQVTVMSFYPFALRRMRALAPHVPRVFLFEHSFGHDLARFGSGIVGPAINVVRARPEVVTRARARGLQVYVWTVNETADVNLAVALGADGIITDRPADVLSRLGR